MFEIYAIWILQHGCAERHDVNDEMQEKQYSNEVSHSNEPETSQVSEKVAFVSPNIWTVIVVLLYFVFLGLDLSVILKCIFNYCKWIVNSITILLLNFFKKEGILFIGVLLNRLFVFWFCFSRFALSAILKCMWIAKLDHHFISELFPKKGKIPFYCQLINMNHATLLLTCRQNCILSFLDTLWVLSLHVFALFP